MDKSSILGTQRNQVVTSENNEQKSNMGGSENSRERKVMIMEEEEVFIDKSIFKGEGRVENVEKGYAYQTNYKERSKTGKEVNGSSKLKNFFSKTRLMFGNKNSDTKTD